MSSPFMNGLKIAMIIAAVLLGIYMVVAVLPMLFIMWSINSVATSASPHYMSSNMSTAPTPPAFPIRPPMDPLTTRSAADYHALASSGKTDGTYKDFRCTNTGDYISGITLSYDDYINAIQMECGRAGATFPVLESPWYGTIGNKLSMINGPFTSISGRGGSVINKLLEHGGSGGDPWTSSCPDGQELSGMRVYDNGTTIVGIIPYCSTS